MCGILGSVAKTLCNKDDSFARLMSMYHRGPDFQKVEELSQHVSFGHVRLSILDLSEAGAQPMWSKCKRYCIVFNGEVYNFKDLKEKYGISDLKSESDTEVILELFALEGIASIVELNGMFAVAIYDAKLQKVYLFRDRLGIKPLYYLNSEDFGLRFASEIKALGCGKKSINISKLHEWSYYGVASGEDTLFRDVKKVPPGTLITYDIGTSSISKEKYWTIPKPTITLRKMNGDSIDSLITKNRSLLEQAVTRQLVSDVPVGVFLSGGIDSSAITAFGSKHYDGKLATYSVGFDFDKGVNELPMAKKLAKKYGTDHTEINISGYEVADLVEKLIHHHDQPFSDAANIPLLLLSEKVRDKTKVILQGDGGDELYGGYRRYKTLSNFSSMRTLARVVKFANKLVPPSAVRSTRERYVNALLAKEPAEVMALLLTVEDRAKDPTRIFSPRIRSEIKNSCAFERYFELEREYKDLPFAEKMTMIDSQIILPEVFLEKVDKATMASSIEVRVPFLDNDLVNFAYSLSARIKMPKGSQKWLLKKSLEGIVPNDVLYGKKTGFGVPFGFWVTGPLKDVLFDTIEAVNSKAPIFSSNAIMDAFNKHTEGLEDNGFLLWKTLNFAIWMRKNNLEL